MSETGIPTQQHTLDAYAAGVARDLDKRTGKRTGWFARIDMKNHPPRVIFSFKLGDAPIVHCTVPLGDLQNPLAWGAMHEDFVRTTIDNSTPLAIQRQKALRNSAPAIAPAIDAQGRRHFRLGAT